MTQKRLLSKAAVVAAAICLAFSWDSFADAMPQSPPESGVDLCYRIPVPVAPELEKTARLRLEALGIVGSGVRIENDLLILRLPGATVESVARVKRLFAVKGELSLHAAAPIPVQTRFNADKVVPDGYRVIENPSASQNPDYEAYGAQMLIRKDPVIEGRHILHAEARKELQPGAARWVTSFEMSADGAKLFDAAAEKLYAMRPVGLVAILLDGVLKSAPAIQSPTFHGRAQISGAKSEDEAKELAIILRTGALPVPLAQPEFERPYNLKK